MYSTCSSGEDGKGSLGKWIPPRVQAWQFSVGTTIELCKQGAKHVVIFPLRRATVDVVLSFRFPPLTTYTEIPLRFSKYLVLIVWVTYPATPLE